MENNPFLQRENYFKGYEESIEELKNKPEVIEFDKLCYQVFHEYEPGRKLLEYCKNRYLIHAMADRSKHTYGMDVIWAEGFKDVFRLFMSHVMSHEQRIQAGK